MKLMMSNTGMVMYWE